MTKIDIISGFLGAGKTTFIKRLLGEALSGEKVVLIENEFGEIGIDGGFLKDFGIEIREMSQGCICCSLVGDFEKSLNTVISQYHPDRIIIEPSGVGKLSDIMKAVTEASASLDVILNSAVTVVDAVKCRMYMKNFGEFFINQVRYAGTIVLTRTDIASPEKIAETVELLRSVNESAEIVTTPLDELSGEKLLAVIEKRDNMLEELRMEALKVPDGESEEEHEHHHHHHHDEKEEQDDDDDDDDDGSAGKDDDSEHDEEQKGEHHHHHHHHHHGHDADEVFESIGFTNVAPVSKQKLENALKELSAEGDEYGTVLRAKGMLKASDENGWYHFDLTPGESEIRKGTAEASGRLCVIGSELKEEKIRALFV